MKQLTIWDQQSQIELQSPVAHLVRRGICFHDDDDTAQYHQRNDWQCELLSFDRNHEWVYLIEAQGTGLVKIGISINPDRRVKQLQTTSPAKLRLVSAFYGTINCERRLHSRFAEHNVQGEWFKDVCEIREYFRAECGDT